MISPSSYSLIPSSFIFPFGPSPFRKLSKPIGSSITYYFTLPPLNTYINGDWGISKDVLPHICELNCEVFDDILPPIIFLLRQSLTIMKPKQP